jgi:spermidine/putrescine transport system ATP-binding protein
VPKGQAGTGPAIEAKFVASEYLGSSVMYFFETAERKVIEVEHHLSLGAPETYQPKTLYELCWKADDALVYGQG